MKFVAISLVVFLGLGPPCAAAPDQPLSNPALQRLKDEDQADRIPIPTTADGWTAMGRHDALRREAVRKLLAEGKLQTAEDFEDAALIFQHSDRSDDYLLAHVLAMVAMEKGSRSAGWLAAATLDRYLHSIGKGQIFGTQFTISSGLPDTQEPFDHALLADSLRRDLGVPALADQQKAHDDAIRAVGGFHPLAAPSAAPAKQPIICDAKVGEHVFLRAKWALYACSNGTSFVFMSGDAIVAAAAVIDKVFVTVAKPGDTEESDAAAAALKSLSPEELAKLVADVKAGQP